MAEDGQPARAASRAWLEALIAAVIAFGLSLIVFAPILGRIADGWAGGDMLWHAVDTTLWRGLSYGWTDQLGYPFGLDRNLIPSLDITQNLFASTVNAAAGGPFVGLNLLLVLSFPLVAALAYTAMRMTGLRGPLAIALAVAFAFVPYHWGRALGHTFLATLFSVVTAVLLALIVGPGAFAERIVDGTRRERAKTLALVTALVVVTAWSGVYYAAFGVLLVAVAAAWRFVAGDGWRRIALAVTPAIAVGVVALLGLLPSILARISDPPLAPLSERLPIESTLFAGSLVMAVLPLPMSVLPYGGYYNEWALGITQGAPAYENLAPTSFGTVITTLALLVFLGALGWRARRRGRHATSYTLSLPEPRTSQVTPGLIATLLAVTTLFFIPWGLNALLANTVSAQIRAWNRLLPVLLLLFLLGAAVVLRNATWLRHRALTVVLAVGVLAVVAVETVVPFRAPFVQSVDDASATTQAAREYATAVNDVLPAGCGILQLPYAPFPESGVAAGSMVEYDHFWTSLLNQAQRWSYGALKNTRASVWMSQLPQTPTDAQLALLTQAGVCAVHVDTDGYEGRASVEQVLSYLLERLGDPVATGNDGRWQLFALPDPAPLPEREQWSPALTAFLLPPFIQTDPTSMTPHESALTTSWQDLTHRSTVVTITPIDPSVPVHGVSGAVQSPGCVDVDVTLTLASGATTTSTTIPTGAGDAPQPFTLTLGAPTAEPATLTIDAPSDGCLVEGELGLRYARIVDLSPNP